MKRTTILLLCMAMLATLLSGCGNNSAQALSSNIVAEAAQSTPEPVRSEPLSAVSETTVFSDVPSTHWAFDSIESAYAKGVLKGIGNGKFEPEATLTRAQVAQIAYNAYGGNGLTKEALKIQDIPGDVWYTEAVTWLLQYDLAELSEGKFYPNDPAPRWFIADVLYKLTVAMDVTLPAKDDAAAFPDLTGDYAKYADAVAVLQKAGIISGFPDGTFGPKEPLTRCQMAKLIDLFTDIPGLEPGTNLPIPEPKPSEPITPEPTVPVTSEPPAASNPPAEEKPTTPPSTTTPEATPPNNNEPNISGSKVWWDSSIYQEILDAAAAKDGVAAHMETTADKVVIYVGAKWPVMIYDRMTFSSSGFTYTTFSWSQRDGVWYDNGSETTQDPDVPLWIVGCTEGNYNYYKDREPWASTSPDVKFPWE